MTKRHVWPIGSWVIEAGGDRVVSLRVFVTEGRGGIWSGHLEGNPSLSECGVSRAEVVGQIVLRIVRSIESSQDPRASAETRESLWLLTVPELLQLCRGAGLTGLSKLRKPTMVDALVALQARDGRA